MKYLPHLYFISIISIFYYPNWSVIDPKAQHWFHVSIINTIYFGYIIFSEKKYLYKVFKSPIFKSIFAFFLISCISATYAINYIESIVKITDIYVLLSSILIILYFCYSNKVSKTVLLYTILITLILDLAGSFYQILQIVQYNEFSFEFVKENCFLIRPSTNNTAIIGIMSCIKIKIILESLNLLYIGNLWMKKSLIPPGSLDASDITRMTNAIKDHFNASFINKTPKKNNTKMTTPK